MSNGKDISMWLDEARQQAAQCWCDDKNNSKEMDTDLCESMAYKIAAWMDTGAFHARNEEYWRNRAIEAEKKLFAAVTHFADDATLARIAELERENAELRMAAAGARQVLLRYRNETPIGRQPHMIAHVADKAIEDIDAAIASEKENERG